MVKRSRVLDQLDAEAAIPYAETALARRAAKARPRLALLLLLGVAGFALEGALARDGWMLAGAAALALVAWGVHRGRLAALIAASFAALVAFGLALVLVLTGGAAWPEKLAWGFVAVWSLLLAPDLVVLARDAELQHAYGLWARRGEP